MTTISADTFLILSAIVFIAVLFMNLVKKNTLVVVLYILQSFAIAVMLLSTSLIEFSLFAITAATLTVAVKIIVAPYFFFRLIERHQLKFSASTYLNAPVTLLVIAVLGALANLNFVAPLAATLHTEQNPLLFSLATIFTSLFLVVNRKGALSQMLGILSLENGIVSFAFFAGLEQSPVLQLGITFDILIWVLIASIFGSIMYRQFGTLDVSAMEKLTER